tara:strand:- start:1296 stop:1691 length:396 start_codon:yes stop_codon:yes gene_type:complete
MITTLIASIALSIDMTPLERAIWKVETNCRTGEIWGDNHTSAGALQIGALYFQDSGIKGKWPQAVFDLDTSVLCFRGYMKRYAKPHRIPEGMSVEEFKARSHVGGPRGPFRKSSLPHWNKVKAELEKANNE